MVAGNRANEARKRSERSQTEMAKAAPATMPQMVVADKGGGDSRCLRFSGLLCRGSLLANQGKFPRIEPIAIAVGALIHLDPPPGAEVLALVTADAAL